jgi:hypothetical protein
MFRTGERAELIYFHFSSFKGIIEECKVQLVIV